MGFYYYIFVGRWAKPVLLKQGNNKISFAFYNLINLINFADINVRLTWYIFLFYFRKQFKTKLILEQKLTWKNKKFDDYFGLHFKRETLFHEYLGFSNYSKGFPVKGPLAWELFIVFLDSALQMI